MRRRSAGVMKLHTAHALACIRRTRAAPLPCRATLPECIAPHAVARCTGRLRKIECAHPRVYGSDVRPGQPCQTSASTLLETRWDLLQSHQTHVLITHCAEYSAQDTLCRVQRAGIRRNAARQKSKKHVPQPGIEPGAIEPRTAYAVSSECLGKHPFYH